MKRYTSNYFKIYIWQTLSILLNLGALFIVLPHLTGNKALYGIYSVCIAATIFLSYIDLGFISAGVKYGAEYFIKGDEVNEKKTIGFSISIFMTLVVVFCLVISFLAFHQGMLFNNINAEESAVAKRLLLILAGSSILVVIQRSQQMIFSIRVEDYLFQIFQIVASIFKIGSIFYFFSPGKYDIVGYFFCCQVFSLIALIGADFLSYKRYKMSFISMLPYFRFSKDVYKRTKGLAFGTLFLTISWILYYELDPYVLAKVSDPKTVALYSVGLTLLAFFRSIFGSLFSPFNVRFNHIIGLDDNSSLKGLYSNTITLLLPLIVLPVLASCILANSFILCWIGPGFAASVIAARFLLLSAVWGFISYPTGILLVARREMKLMYVIGTIQPILYWAGIAIFYRFIGFNIFAICTFVVFTNMAVFYTNYSIRFLGINLKTFAKTFLLPAIPSVLVLISLLLMVSPYLPQTKGAFHLITVIGAGVGAFCISLVVYYFFCAGFKQ
jgi:O-antigen/teichoic acid export membrane protein